MSKKSGFSTIILLVITVIITLFLAGALLFQKRDANAQSSLDALQINFGSPSAILPLDRALRHRVSVKNTGANSLAIDFRIFVKDTNQEIVAWPQPQTLYLGPGEEKIAKTFLDEMWGRLDRNAPGEYTRNVEWTFIDRATGASRKDTVAYRYTVLPYDKIAGDLKINGKVIDAKQKPVRDVSVSLSTGPGGWSAFAKTGSDGSFSFAGVPRRNDWVLEAKSAGGRAFAAVESNKTAYTLTLRKPIASASYKVVKTEKTEIGFFDGDVDADERYALLINGMENWRNFDLKSRSKLYLYTLDGELKWTYDMGWEGWDASLSRDGKYASFVTSGSTRNLGVIDTASGKPLWVKNAGEFKPLGNFREVDSREMQISSSGKYVGLGSADGTIFLLELSTGRQLWAKFLNGQVRGIIFDKNDEFVYAGSGDGNAYKLNIKDGSVVWKADIGSWPFGFKFSSDESLLAAGGKFGEATVIETKSGKKLWQSDQAGAVTWLDLSPDGKYLVAGGGGQSATTLFEARTGKKLWKINEFSHQGKFSADGKFLIMGDHDLKIIDINGNELQTIQPAGYQSGQGLFSYLSKNGQNIIFAGRDIDPGAVSIVFARGAVKSLAVEEDEEISVASQPPKPTSTPTPAEKTLETKPSIQPEPPLPPQAPQPETLPKQPGDFFWRFKNLLKSIFGFWR